MSIQKPDDSIVNGTIWFILALLVFIAWGTQTFFMKKTNTFMKAESIFFYMMVSGILLTPIAYFMTDMSQEIDWGF